MSSDQQHSQTLQYSPHSAAFAQPQYHPHGQITPSGHQRLETSDIDLSATSPSVTLGKHARQESIDDGGHERSASGPDAAGDTTAEANGDGGPPPKLFRCGDCDKRYSRVDHLARHVRIHTKERPYVCETCGKGFARADLLKRHVAGHKNQAASAAGKNGAAAAARQSRVNQACEACAELHLKCDNVKPCSRCKVKGISCRYQTATNETEVVAQNLLRLSQAPNLEDDSTPPDMAGQPQQPPANNMYTPLMHHTLPPPPPPQPQMPMSNYDFVQPPPINPLNGPMATHPPPPPMFPPHDPMAQHRPDQYQFQHPGNMGVPQNVYPQGATQIPPEADRNELHDFLRGVMGINQSNAQSQEMMGMQHDPGFRSGVWTPRNMYDFGGDTNIELTDMDLSFLDNYNQNNPFGATPDATGSTYGSVMSDGPSEPPLGIESMQKASTWRFRPLQADNVPNNLHMPATESSKRVLVDKRLTPEAMTNAVRDHILGMTIKASSDDKPVQSFPSVELLDSLLQYSLQTNAASTEVFHANTFKPSKKRPELCAIMIAAGAAAAPDPTMRKLGMVLQESARISLPKLVESDNSTVRDVQVVQASLLGLEIGIWSGNSRKMEISESFLQPFATMTRRAGWFGRKYELIIPSVDDKGDALEKKWQAWIEQESRKRLCFQMFSHDTRASISLFINPNISYAELSLPLPQHGSLWHAPTAQAWKAAYAALPDPQAHIPSTIDLLNNIDLFCTPNMTFDHAIAARALHGAAWRMIWEFRQQASITRAVPNQWNSGTLLLGSRLEELKRLLDCLRIGSSQHRTNNNSWPGQPLYGQARNVHTVEAEIPLLLEMLSLHLHVSMEDIHVFTGVEGPEEARRVYPNLKDYARTPHARQAVWHACRVLRHARDISNIINFNAVVIYQASLVLWSWGVISNAVGTPAQSSAMSVEAMSNGGSVGYPLQQDDIVLLDDPNSDGMAKRFIAMGRGRPGMSLPPSASGWKKDTLAQANDTKASAARRKSEHWSTVTPKAAVDKGHVLLSDPAAVMGVAMDLVATSHKTKNSRPSLLENLLELMGGLRMAVLVGN